MYLFKLPDEIHHRLFQSLVAKSGRFSLPEVESQE